MILYRENSKESVKKLRINNFSEVAEYKINIQKSIAFLYSNDEALKKKENHPNHNSIKNNKILRNKFNQGSKRSAQ